MEMASRESTKL